MAEIVDFMVYKAEREAEDEICFVWVDWAIEPQATAYAPPAVEFAPSEVPGPYKIKINEPAASAGLLPPCDCEP